MSIFDVQPPAWLEQIAKPVSSAGTLLGAGLAGLLKAGQLAKASGKEAQAEFEKDPEQYFKDKPQAKTWLQELPQGIAEARMNLADPLWKLKLQQHGLALKHTQMQMDELHQRMQTQAHELDLETEDSKKHAQWTMEKRADPSRPPPAMSSLKWQNQMRLEEQADARQGSNAMFAKDDVDMSRQMGRLTPAHRAAVQALNTGRPENRLKERAAMWGAIDQYLKEEGQSLVAQPQVLNLTLPDGRTVSGTVDAKGNFKEFKPPPTAKPTPEEKAAAKTKDQLSKNIETLNRQIRKLDADYDAATVEAREKFEVSQRALPLDLSKAMGIWTRRNDLIKQRDQLQEKAAAPAQAVTIGKFKVEPGDTMPVTAPTSMTEEEQADEEEEQ